MPGTPGPPVARLAVAGALASVLIISAGPARIDTHAVGGLNTITVSPTHGKPAAAFAVTYSISPCIGAAGLSIGFSWNALSPAGPLLGTSVTDSNCRATLSTTPPLNPATHAGPAAGNYQVFGYVALPTGTPTPNTGVSTTYTVDVIATSTPTPTATTTAKATSHPSASATSAPTASASGTGSLATLPSAAAGSTPPGQNPEAVASRAAGQPGWSTLAWRVVGGVVVLALVLAALALLAGWIIRQRRARAAAGIRNDRAA